MMLRADPDITGPQICTYLQTAIDYSIIIYFTESVAWFETVGGCSLHVALMAWRSFLHRLNALEVTDMSDYETFSLVILIIGLVISAITLGITIGKKDKK